MSDLLPPRHRVRATTLLRFVTFGMSVGLLAGAYALACWVNSDSASVGVLVVGLVAIGTGIAPRILAGVVVYRAERSSGPIDSLFVVDIDEEHRRRVDAMLDDTRDHPTIR